MLISLCLVCSWETWLEEICNTDWLSQYNSDRQMNGGQKSSWIKVNHWISLVDAKAWYSTSEELLESVDCFLERHDINESPI